MLLFSPEGDLFLIRFLAELRGEPFVFWVTPGGEVGAGESDPEAAARELDEETGVRVPLSGPVHEESGGTYTHLGETVRNHDVFFAAVCDRTAPQLLGITAEELGLMREARWWSQSELSRTEERVYPSGLASVAARVRSELGGGSGG